jgi:hypothetical protein
MIQESAPDAIPIRRRGKKQVADADILPLSTLWAKVDWVVVGHPLECNPPYTRTRKRKNQQKRNVWFSAAR